MVYYRVLVTFFILPIIQICVKKEYDMTVILPWHIFILIYSSSTESPEGVDSVAAAVVVWCAVVGLGADVCGCDVVLSVTRSSVLLVVVDLVL